eukprot:6184086-Pleurochrysis_carterae.AAC.2
MEYAVLLSSASLDTAELQDLYFRGYTKPQLSLRAGAAGAADPGPAYSGQNAAAQWSRQRRCNNPHT